MRFDIVTIFPEFFAGPLDHGIIRRAREAAIADVRVHDLRRWTRDRHRTVDDRPFGGGAGMVLKPEPIFEAVEELLGVQADPQSGGASAVAEASATAIVLLSAAGKLFRQAGKRLPHTFFILCKCLFVSSSSSSSLALINSVSFDEAPANWLIFVSSGC